MSHWRPASTIKTKAIGLLWKNDRLLASAVLDDNGSLKGVRPLGGHIEFGETWRQTLVREFDEELSIKVKIVGEPIFLENIYEHHGATGHEYVFAAEVQCCGDDLTDKDEIFYQEDNGETHIARWYDLNQLDRDGIPLFPVGLKQKLRDR